MITFPAKDQLVRYTLCAEIFHDPGGKFNEVPDRHDLKNGAYERVVDPRRLADLRKNADRFAQHIDGEQQQDDGAGDRDRKGKFGFGKNGAKLRRPPSQVPRR